MEPTLAGALLGGVALVVSSVIGAVATVRMGQAQRAAARESQRRADAERSADRLAEERERLDRRVESLIDTYQEEIARMRATIERLDKRGGR